MRHRDPLGLAFVPPMLPTLVDEAPEGSDWIHEIKYDGWRTQIVIDNGSIRVFTRNAMTGPTGSRPSSRRSGLCPPSPPSSTVR